ncbi:MAG: hypothetical protein IJ244_02905 [Bacteroidaceae bacterium]|nr:hypothetical protein [Bacteroidaceae bacterium]
MKKYMGRGELIFAAALAYFLTWTNALNLETFGLRELGFLIWALAFNYVIVIALLWVATRFTKKPIFGQVKAYYYPFRQMLIASLIIVAVFALINYISGPHLLTTQRIVTYIVGYILGVAAIMTTFYLLTKRKE